MTETLLLNDAIDTVRFLTDDMKRLSKKEKKGAINLLSHLLTLEQAKKEQDKQSALYDIRKSIAEYPRKDDVTLRIYTDVKRYADAMNIPIEKPKRYRGDDSCKTHYNSQTRPSKRRRNSRKRS